MRELLGHRDFRLLLAGQALSMAGEWTLLLVFGIWAKTLTGSSAVAGLTVFAMAAPGLLGPFAGVLVDRVPRRAVVIALNAVSAAVVSTLWLVQDRSQLWLLFAVAAWSGLASVARNAAITGLVQSMMPPALVGPANGALATVRQGLRLVGPLVGAALFTAVGGRWVAALDATAFLVSAGVLLALHHREVRFQRSPGGFGSELAAGLVHLWRTPSLRPLAAATVVFSAAIGLVEPAVYALVDDGLHRTPDFVGVLVSVQGVGAVVAGAVVSAAITRVSELPLVAGGLALIGLGAGLSAVPSLPVVLLGFALVGAGLPTMAVAVATLLQRLTPAPLMGRAAAGYDVLGSVPTTTSIAVGAVLVTGTSYQVIFGVSAAGCAAAAVVVAWAWRAAASGAPLVPTGGGGPQGRRG